MKFLNPIEYYEKLNATLQNFDWSLMTPIVQILLDAWKSGTPVYLCGNGGSAGNASHLSNDFMYGVGKGETPGLNVQALSSNPSIITCLGNDEGYESIYSGQLQALGKEGEVLIVLSGSGNSPNILKVLDTARTQKLTTIAILGFDGGKAKELADYPLHFPITDMQIAEDIQMIVGHILAKMLSQKKFESL